MSKKKSDPKPDTFSRVNGTTVDMSPEQQAALEAEKAAILASLTERGTRGSVKVYIPIQPTTAPAPVKMAEVTPAEPTPPTPPARPVAELKAEMQALERQLAEAQRQEAAVRQHEAAAAQRAAQRQAAADLAPLKPQIIERMARLTSLQRTHGPALRDLARSCASGPDAQVRAQLASAYADAAPLGQRLGSARHVIEGAIHGLEQAAASGAAHIHSQAKTLAESALAIDLDALTNDITALISRVTALRGGRLEVQPTTPDRLDPRDLRGPSSSLTSVDFGRSILS